MSARLRCVILAGILLAIATSAVHPRESCGFQANNDGGAHPKLEQGAYSPTAWKNTVTWGAGEFEGHEWIPPARPIFIAGQVWIAWNVSWSVKGAPAIKLYKNGQPWPTAMARTGICHFVAFEGSMNCQLPAVIDIASGKDRYSVHVYVPKQPQVSSVQLQDGTVVSGPTIDRHPGHTWINGACL